MKREEMKARSKVERFDLLIVGAGATGCGIAWDASLRGYSVCLIDSGDFCGQTSSKSTKLLHGGVRYLEHGQFSLVREGLIERGILLKMAPHLTRSLPIVVPTYSWSEKSYYWMGMKVYDALAGKWGIGKSHTITKDEVKRLFPQIEKELTGGVVYYDGQFDDTRLNISVIHSAVERGAVACNYIKMVEMGIVEDQITKERWSIDAKVIINSTGVFSDHLRKIDNPKAVSMMTGSSGTHIILDKKYTEMGSGLLIPKTADGRVLFMLPWQGRTLVGTTDEKVEISENSKPTESDITFIKKHLHDYLGISEPKIFASWSGIRPLVGVGENTALMSRDFAIERSPSGMYSIAGGKWTSFRRMAEVLLDRIVVNNDLPKKGDCMTKTTPLWGYCDPKEVESRLKKTYDPDIAMHLATTYGSMAYTVASLGLDARLHPDFPIIEAEIEFAKEEEMAIKKEDIYCRRTHLGLLDQKDKLWNG